MSEMRKSVGWKDRLFETPREQLWWERQPEYRKLLLSHLAIAIMVILALAFQAIGTLFPWIAIAYLVLYGSHAFRMAHRVDHLSAELSRLRRHDLSDGSSNALDSASAGQLAAAPDHGPPSPATGRLWATRRPRGG